MRNLKKFLALTLALMMALSVMVTVNAADVTVNGDLKENYEEAVEVLSALGVIKGNGSGVYKPNEKITRAEFATMIYRIASGDVDGASVATYAQYADFSDVSPASWYAGYVGYAQVNGYLAGTGGGKYSPNADITGYEVLTALLRVLGYDQNGELTGNPSWQLNALGTAKSIEMTDGVAAADQNWPAKITREVVAELFFTTLTATNRVTYSSFTNVYNQEDATLGDVVFGLAKSGDASFPQEGAEGEEDGFGRPAGTAEFWSPATGFIGNGTAAPVYESKGKAVDTTALAAALGKESTELNSVDVSKYYEDGVSEGGGTPNTHAKLDSVTGGNGVNVEVYKDADNDDKVIVVVINTNVIKLNADADKDGFITLENNVSYKDASLKKGDIVSYQKCKVLEGETPVKTGETYKAVKVAKVEAKNVTVTSYGTESDTKAPYVRLDGASTHYYLADKFVNDDTFTGLDKLEPKADTTYDVYMVNGYVVYGAEHTESNAEPESKYVYVLDAEAVAGTSAGSMLGTEGTPAKAMAEVVDLATGKTSTVSLTVVLKDGEWYYADTTGEKDNENKVADCITSAAKQSDTYLKERIGKLCTMTSVGDGYVLNKVERTLATISADDDVVIEKGNANVKLGSNHTSLMADGNTRLVVLAATMDAAENTKIAECAVEADVNGYKNFINVTHKDGSPSSELDAANGKWTVLCAMYTEKNGVLENIYVIVKNAVKAEPVSLAVYLRKGETTADGTYYKFLVDGAEKEYLCANAKLEENTPGDGFVQMTNGNVYTLKLDGTKLVGTAAADQSDADVTIKSVSEDYVVGSNNNVYYLATGCTVVNKNAMATATMAQGDKVTFYYANAEDKTNKQVGLALISSTDVGVAYVADSVTIESPSSSGQKLDISSVDVSASDHTITITITPDGANKKVTNGTTKIKLKLKPTGAGAKIGTSGGPSDTEVELTLTNSNGTSWSCSSHVYVKPASGAEVNYSTITVSLTTEADT